MQFIFRFKVKYITQCFHTLSESVFCCALHPGGTHVATGGEDDRLVVRDATKNFDVDFESGGDAFKDSVVQAAFSGKDGAFLAAADMSGVIKVWKVAAREVVWEFETSDITVTKSEHWR